ncbi:MULTISPECIES: DUF4377 domain-containing protein [unclassified Moraxella]|uniref:DUF4377 domain-containing protein n=1 Tax=unclassified Moraxella TaxID=2685852 RepID=UPI003AF815F2
MKPFLMMTSIATIMTLTACQTQPMSTNPSKPTTPLSQQIPTATDLQNYQWQLVEAKDNAGKVIQALDLSTYGIAKDKAKVTLDFKQTQQNAEGNLGMSYSVGCNAISKTVNYQSGMAISKGMVISTLMGCGKLDSAENTLRQKMTGNSKFVWQASNTQSAILVQTTADNSTLTWQGKLKPQTQYGKGETLFLEVNPLDQPCDAVTGKRCLQVREVRYDSQGIKTGAGEWQLLHETIDGYRHDPALRQIIRVQRYRTPPKDTMGYGRLYVLDSVVESAVVGKGKP